MYLQFIDYLGVFPLKSKCRDRKIKQVDIKVDKSNWVGGVYFVVPRAVCLLVPLVPSVPLVPLVPSVLLELLVP